MTSLIEQFQNCYLVQYSIDPGNVINPIKAMPLVEKANKYGGTFIGVKGGGPYGIRFVQGATHLGIFDFTDTENPIKVYSIEYEKLQPNKPHLVKTTGTHQGAYMTFSRANKNFKFVVSEYKSSSEHKKAILLKNKSTKKVDAHTAKAQSVLKNMKHRKA